MTLEVTKSIHNKLVRYASYKFGEDRGEDIVQLMYENYLRSDSKINNLFYLVKIEGLNYLRDVNKVSNGGGGREGGVRVVFQPLGDHFDTIAPVCLDDPLSILLAIELASTLKIKSSNGKRYRSEEGVKRDNAKSAAKTRALRETHPEEYELILARRRITAKIRYAAKKCAT